VKEETWNLRGEIETKKVLVVGNKRIDGFA
jgi:hypothetical protein